MNKKLVYVGLDVDDTRYHGTTLNKANGELFNFRRVWRSGAQTP